MKKVARAFGILAYWAAILYAVFVAYNVLAQAVSEHDLAQAPNTADIIVTALINLLVAVAMVAGGWAIRFALAGIRSWKPWVSP